MIFFIAYVVRLFFLLAAAIDAEDSRVKLDGFSYSPVFAGFSPETSRARVAPVGPADVSCRFTGWTAVALEEASAPTVRSDFPVGRIRPQPPPMSLRVTQ